MGDWEVLAGRRGFCWLLVGCGGRGGGGIVVVVVVVVVVA